MDYTRKVPYPTSLASAGYNTGALNAENAVLCSQAKPESELASDIRSMIAAQELGLRMVEEIYAKIFGPVPPGTEKGEIHADHLTALLSRSRRLASDITDRLEGINANI